MNLLNKSAQNALFLAVLFSVSILLSGCAAVLIAGGVVGGYAIAQHVDIKPKEEKKSGFFK